MKAGGGRAMGKTKSVNREKNAYYIRVFFRKPWDEIARRLHFSGHSAVIKAAKRYALRHNLPWPLKGMPKGKKIYTARKIGLTWQLIAKRYNQTKCQVRRTSYKYAIRNDMPWPPTTKERS